MRSVIRNYKMFCVLLLLLACAVFCLLAFNYKIHSPAEAVHSYIIWFRLRFGELLHTGIALRKDELISQVDDYGQLIKQVRVAALIFLCGVMMALSGTIFQSVFRNPMAAPTMLGVNTGVQAGIMLLVVQYGAAAEYMMGLKYVYCYIGAGLMLGAVLIVGKISSGRKRMSVFDLILVASILSGMVSAVISNKQLTMDNDEALLIQQISSVLDPDVSARAFAFLGIAAAISIIPMILLRFSFNAVSFENDDSRSMGINVYIMKFLTLIFGTIMITAAMIHCGTAGMISLIAPFAGRKLFGANFKKNFFPTMMIGGAVLLACKGAVGLIPYGDQGMPLGTMVNFVMLPFFVLIMANMKGVKQAWLDE